MAQLAKRIGVSERFGSKSEEATAFLDSKFCTGHKSSL